MSETPLVTNAVARDLVRQGDHDETINTAWSEGKDTRAIASDLGVREAEVANRISPFRTEWPESSITTLRRMWDEGHTATEIARELHGVSRSAVLGKVHRLGLEARRPAYPVVVRAKAQSDDDRRLTQVIRRQEKARRQRERALARLAGPKLKAVPILAAEAPRAEYLNVGLLDLNRDQCRYSPSDDAPFLFCGQPVLTGHSWCEHCCAVVYAPPKSRADKRPWRPTPGMAA
jgi:GcrA cell cycle regulator